MIYTLRENINGGVSKYKTTLEYYKLENKKYRFIFMVYDTKKTIINTGYNSNLYEANVVELFFADNKNRNKYLEIEVSPDNSHFNAFVIKNKEGDRELEFIDKSFDFYSEIEDLNENTQKITIEIDLSKYIQSDDYCFNAYRIENETDRQYLIALNPTLSETFHKTDSFIKLYGN